MLLLLLMLLLLNTTKSESIIGAGGQLLAQASSLDHLFTVLLTLTYQTHLVLAKLCCNYKQSNQQTDNTKYNIIGFIRKFRKDLICLVPCVGGTFCMRLYVFVCICMFLNI